LDHFSLKRLRQRARYRKAKSTVKRKKSKSAEQDKPPQKKKRAGSFSLSGWIGSLSGRLGVHRCSAHSAQQSLELTAWSNLPPNSFPGPPLRASAFRLRS
jgi:hypothetical protein